MWFAGDSKQGTSLKHISWLLGFIRMAICTAIRYIPRISNGKFIVVIVYGKVPGICGILIWNKLLLIKKKLSKLVYCLCQWIHVVQEITIKRLSIAGVERQSASGNGMLLPHCFIFFSFQAILTSAARPPWNGQDRQHSSSPWGWNWCAIKVRRVRPNPASAPDSSLQDTWGTICLGAWP